MLNSAEALLVLILWSLLLIGITSVWYSIMKINYIKQLRINKIKRSIKK